jgi:hypothetical protein
MPRAPLLDTCSSSAVPCCLIDRFEPHHCRTPMFTALASHEERTFAIPRLVCGGT